LTANHAKYADGILFACFERFAVSKSVFIRVYLWFDNLK